MSAAAETFQCFGGHCAVRVSGAEEREVANAVQDAKRILLAAHDSLSRFDPESELSRLNRDPRETVPASPLLRRTVAAALLAGLRSGGLVDATLVEEIEAAGYAGSREFSDERQTPASPPRRIGAPSRRAGWCHFAVDEGAGTVSRPRGIKLDPGGIAKGLLGDLVGERLAGFDAYAVDCCGDLRLGGAGGRIRRVLVDDPRGGGPLHELRVADGAVATSGITRRAWTDEQGRRAHQILDPATGRPAFTGVIQATAVAPTGLLAETLAKSALLVGPEAAASRLPFGGVIVEEGGAVRVVEAAGAVLPGVLAA